MSRYRATITPGNGKQVRREGHSLLGIDVHAAGTDTGVHIEARSDAYHGDLFTIYVTDGQRTSQSRYARTVLGTVRRCSDGRIAFESDGRPPIVL